MVSQGSAGPKDTHTNQSLCHQSDVWVSGRPKHACFGDYRKNKGVKPGQNPCTCGDNMQTLHLQASDPTQELNPRPPWHGRSTNSRHVARAVGAVWQVFSHCLFAANSDFDLSEPPSKPVLHPQNTHRWWNVPLWEENMCTGHSLLSKMLHLLL